MKKRKQLHLDRFRNTLSKLKKRSSAFTLVEILVVIVIIAILPAIIFISSSAIRHNATVALIVGDLDGAAKQVKMFRTNSDAYPDTISCLESDSETNKCIALSPGLEYEYSSNNSLGAFCLDATKSDITYHIAQGLSPQPGPCPDVDLEVANNSNGDSGYIQGDTWQDKSGNSHNGKLENGAGYTNSNGGAVGLDGVDDYVDVNYKLNENNGSISMWYYAEPWYQYQQVFDNSNDPDDWEMWIDTNGVLHARIENDLSVSYDLDSIYGPNHWYHIVISWKKSSTELKLYVNGSQRNSDNLGGWSNTGDDIYFGGGNSGNTKANGLIRSINVHDKRMSDTDIRSIFDNSKDDFGY